MRWCFWTQMEDYGRMQARVIQVLDRLQTPIEALSFAKLDGRIFLTCVVEADQKQASRIESLLRKIHGMISTKVLAETATAQRMIALVRILCDITDRSEVLHFINAFHARAIMIRPLWVAFEVVGTPQEIEGIYQSALGYGIVDLVSSSCAFMTSSIESERGAALGDELEAAPV